MRSKAAGQLTLILIYDLFNLFISQPQLTPPPQLYTKQYAAGWCPCILGLQWSSLTVDPQLRPPSDSEVTRGEPCIFFICFLCHFLLLHSQFFGMRIDAATLFFFICFHFLLSFSFLHLKIVWNSQEGCSLVQKVSTLDLHPVSLRVGSLGDLSSCHYGGWLAPPISFPVISKCPTPPQFLC